VADDHVAGHGVADWLRVSNRHCLLPCDCRCGHVPRVRLPGGNACPSSWCSLSPALTLGTTGAGTKPPPLLLIGWVTPPGHGSAWRKVPVVAGLSALSSAFGRDRQCLRTSGPLR
jgi:hypothetical protein